MIADDDSGPRSEVRILQLWEFRLGRRDALLVLQALGGRLFDAEQLHAARELGDRLTALRVRELEQGARQGVGLRANLEKATGRTVEEILGAPS